MNKRDFFNLLPKNGLEYVDFNGKTTYILILIIIIIIIVIINERKEKKQVNE